MKNIRHESITNIVCVHITLAIRIRSKTEASMQATRAHSLFFYSESIVDIAREARRENGYECSLQQICEHAKLAHREFHVSFCSCYFWGFISFFSSSEFQKHFFRFILSFFAPHFCCCCCCLQTCLVEAAL